jgi:hypothetical protein
VRFISVANTNQLCGRGCAGIGDHEAMTAKQTRFDVEDIDDHTSVASVSASPHLSHATSTTSALSVYVTPQSSPILDARRSTDHNRNNNDLDGSEALPTQSTVVGPVREFQVSSPATSPSHVQPGLATQHSLDFADTVERVPMTMFYREDSSDNRGFNQRRPTLKELHEPMRVDEVSQQMSSNTKWYILVTTSNLSCSYQGP